VGIVDDLDMRLAEIFGKKIPLGRGRHRNSGRQGGATYRFPAVAFLCGIYVLSTVSAAAQDQRLQIDPAESTVKFTVGDVLHTVRGTFKLKRGTLQLQSAGKMSGEVVVDASSGNSGSGMRDRKMHKEVLESAKYPEINFRPDRFDGNVAQQGQSSVIVHGMFSIHGTDREITVPAQVEMNGDRWNANVHFTVPYAKWGMKNPSTLFLKVSDTVTIDLTASGSMTRSTAVSSQ
jgi:polyisoprenoid-binding protein YceI